MPLSSGSLTSRRRLTSVSSSAGLERHRHQSIRLCLFSLGPSIPGGLWIGTANADHLYHEEGTTPYHQTHISLHELAHMLLNHRGATQVRERLVNMLVPRRRSAARPAGQVTASLLAMASSWGWGGVLASCSASSTSAICRYRTGSAMASLRIRASGVRRASGGAGLCARRLEIAQQRRAGLA